MAISAYELLECVGAMTPEQRGELRRQLEGSLLVHAEAAEERNRRFRKLAQDVVQGLAELDQGQCVPFLDAIRRAIALAVPLQRDLLATQLADLLTSAKFAPAALSPTLDSAYVQRVRKLLGKQPPSGVPAAAALTLTPLPNPTAQELRANVQACLQSLKSPVRDPKAIYEALKAEMERQQGRPILVGDPGLKVQSHDEHLIDAIRGMDFADAARYIADYVANCPFADFQLDEVLDAVCNHPAARQLANSKHGLRSLNAAVRDLLDKSAIRDVATWVAESAPGPTKDCPGTPFPTPTEFCPEWPIGIKVEAGDDHCMVRALTANCMHLSASVSIFNRYKANGEDKREIKVDFETDLSVLDAVRDGAQVRRKECHLVLHNVTAPAAVMESFLKSYGDVTQAAQNHLVLSHEDFMCSLELRHCVLTHVSDVSSARGLMKAGEMTFLGCEVLRRPRRQDRQAVKEEKYLTGADIDYQLLDQAERTGTYGPHCQPAGRRLEEEIVDDSGRRVSRRTIGKGHPAGLQGPSDIVGPQGQPGIPGPGGNPFDRDWSK